MRSTAPGCAASASAPSAWRCITSSATRSAARFDLPHAETHTIVLPHALAYNAPAVPEAMARIARAIGAADAAQGLYDLAKRLGAKVALRDIGMPESGIDKAADLAVTNAYWNPRPLERDAIRDLIARAWAGEPPVATKAAA